MELKPENETEARIITDSYFQAAMRIGRPREYHPEGVLGTHVQQMLAAIDSQAREPRPLLRLAALLHDVGKLAFVEKSEGLHPECGTEELGQLFDVSRRFSQEFAYPVTYDDQLVPKHALYSWQFAKRFTQDPVLLDLIRYHDTCWNLCDIKDSPQYTDSLLEQYFGGKPAALYVIFGYIDALNKEKTRLLWLQDEFLRMGWMASRVV